MKKILLPFLLIVIIAALYSQVRHFDFINFDDNLYVTENSHVSTGLTWSNIQWAFTNTEAGHWHPLTWLSHQLDVTLFGLTPAAPHLENVFFHILNTLLLFWLLIRLFANPIPAFLCSLLFAVHPMRLESVVWIAERKDVLSAFFGLLIFHSHVSWRKSGKNIFWILSILLLALGLLAKPSLVVIPVLLLLMDYCYLGIPPPLRGGGQGAGDNFDLTPLPNPRETSLFMGLPQGERGSMRPHFLLAFLFSIIAILSQAQVGGLKTLHVISTRSRLSTTTLGYLAYMGKTVWPNNLSIFEPYRIFPLSFGIGALLALLIFGFCIWQWGNKTIIFGALWFLVSLLPVIGILAVGGQFTANRWLYLPHIGLAIMLCGLCVNLQKWRVAVNLLLVGVTLSLATKTFVELPYWQNSQTIFARALEFNQNNFMAHNNLGLALWNAGEHEKAIDQFEKAVQQNSTYPEALNNLGMAYATTGRFAEAIPLFEKALRVNPHHVQAKHNLTLARYKIETYNSNK